MPSLVTGYTFDPAGVLVTPTRLNSQVNGGKITFSVTDVLVGRKTTGAGDWEEIACTAAGRALLDDANADAQLATLGGGVTGIEVLKTATKATARAALDLDTGNRPQFVGVDLVTSSPRVDFTDSASSANQKRGRIAVSTGQFRFQRVSDDGNTITDAFRINENGDMIIAPDRRFRLGSSFVGSVPTITGYLLVEDSNGNLFRIAAQAHA